MINEITIITTLVKSNTRRIQLERFIKYHLRFKCKIIVIIPRDIEISLYQEDNLLINYIHCDANTTQLNKFKLAYECCATEYIVWVADDDFLGLDFTRKSIKLLNKDQKVAACNGLTIFYDEGFPKRRNYVYSFEYYLLGLKFKKTNISRYDILKYNAENFDPSVVHGIIRTKVFIELVNFAELHNVPARWGDAIGVFVILMHGTIHYINSISGIRSYDTRLLENDPNVYQGVEIPVTSLILNQEFINNLYDYYISLKGKISPKITAGILYYLLYSSRVIDNARERRYKPIKKYYMILTSYLEVVRLRLFNTAINEDIKLAKKLMKEYSLKGNE